MKGESMRKITKHVLAGVALIAFAASGGQAIAADRTADEILKELDGVTIPKFDRAKSSDPAYGTEIRAAQQKAVHKRSELILELYRAAPDNEKLAKLLPERWSICLMATSAAEASKNADKTYKEVVEELAHTKNEKIKVEGAFVKARIKLTEGRASGNPDLTDLNEFIKLAPKDPRGASGLYAAANMTTKDEKAKAAIEDRIIKEFPDSMPAGMISGSRRQKEAIGKPFDLEFTDAIKGSTVSIKGLKGKVVVIDFWATWCPPCVAEMPKMKEIYAKYHDKGVEFIGVSLDQPKEAGGLDKLKKFVTDNEIAWPQYYQGKGWDSEFSKSWGINSIPCMFVVDQDGKLVTVEGREQIETLIPDLLKKKEAAAGAGAGAGGQ
jgi:thiol-disulfide isomerase/thioredoxin